MNKACFAELKCKQYVLIDQIVIRLKYLGLVYFVKESKFDNALKCFRLAYRYCKCDETPSVARQYHELYKYLLYCNIILGNFMQCKKYASLLHGIDTTNQEWIKYNNIVKINRHLIKCFPKINNGE